MSDPINILFLGESGIGKSTLISSIVNALQYQTFQDVLKDEGGHCLFTCKFTQFINYEPISVCRKPTLELSEDLPCSYTVSLEDRDLVLIDTPGLRDLNGLEEDDRNLTKVLAYIANVKKLSAICLVMRPEDGDKSNAALDGLMRSFLTYLPTGFHTNLLFCFVNTLSQSYRPGTIISLITKYFPKELKFNKSTVFCFENDAFQYICSTVEGNHIRDEDLRLQYEKNWKISSAEAIRLIELIAGMDTINTEVVQSRTEDLAYELMQSISKEYQQLAEAQSLTESFVEKLYKCLDH